MTADAAEKAAPWLEPGELAALKRWARSISFDEIGSLIKLTFAEYEKHKAWRFWPCDRSRQEVREWMKQRQADNERKRRDDERYWKQQLSVASQRDGFVWRKLAKGATTLPKLYESARHSPAFWPPGGGGPWPSDMSFLKKGQAHRLRTALHTVVNRMERRRDVETWIGPDGVRHVRRVDFSPDFKVETRRAKRQKKLTFSFSRNGYAPKTPKAQQPQRVNPDFETRGHVRLPRQKPSASRTTPTPSPSPPPARPPATKGRRSLHDERGDRAVLSPRTTFAARRR
jgi:hypothetical protein